MFQKAKAVASAIYNLALQVSEDWWQLGICWAAWAGIIVNGVVLPLWNKQPASLGELAALVGSAATLVGVHAWRVVQQGKTDA